MTQKTKNLVSFILFLTMLIATSLFVVFWAEGKNEPIWVLDAVKIQNIDANQPLSFTLRVYNSGKYPMKLGEYHLSGEGWQLVEAHITSEELFTHQTLSAWANGREDIFSEVSGHRIPAGEASSLALTIQRAERHDTNPILEIGYTYLWRQHHTTVKLTNGR